MTTAIVYEIGNDGQQREACRLELHDGKIAATNNCPLGRLVLSREVEDHVEGRLLTRRDGLAFLQALPAAYSGTRVRVGLKNN